jgi:hypothetical protein
MGKENCPSTHKSRYEKKKKERKSWECPYGVLENK